MIQKTVLLAALWTSAAMGVDLLPSEDIDRLALQRYWHLHLPLDGGEAVTRMALVDDNLYVLTTANRALAVHANTGVIRWSALVAEPEQSVRGPTHARDYVLFTTPGSVRVLDRRSGDAAGRAQTLRGFLTEVSHDMATTTIGEAHGVRDGDTLKVYRASAGEDLAGNPIAELRILTVSARSARGRLSRLETIDDAKPGDRVFAEVTLPLGDVKLPFAASSAAVSDGKSLFVGAANQRLYSIEILTGIEQWQVMTPRTVTTTPILRGEWLYWAGQDGVTVCCTKAEKAKNWTFQTEGAIFAEPFMDSDRMYVSSSDRSLYCLDRMTGGRVWRQRFDTPLLNSPTVAEGRVYQEVPEHGLVAVNAKTGVEVWRRAEGGQFLLQIGQEAYVWNHQAAKEISRLNPENGRRREWVNSGAVEFAVASQKDQSVFLANAGGDLMCLRSKNAPSLKPEQLQEVLRNDAKMRLAAEMTAKEHATSRPAGPEKKPEIPWWDQEDSLASRSTATPLGGHGLVKPKGAEAAQEQKAATSAPAEKSEESSESAEEGAEGGEEAAKPADDESEVKETTTQKSEDEEEGESKESDEGSEKSKEKEDEGP